MNEPTTTNFQIRLPIIFAAVLALGMLLGQRLPRPDALVKFTNHPNSSAGFAGAFDEIIRYIEAKYVDTIETSALKTRAINHLLQQLDPHSVYISAEEFKLVEDDMTGDFEGIGVEFIMLDDTIQVVTPLSGGPAETAGVRAGDKIVTIEDSTVAGIKIETASIYKKLRGPKGSPVKIGVKRGKELALQHFTILRDVIPVKSVEVAYMLDQDIAYIKINRFSAKTHQEFIEALSTLVEKQNAKRLVLDLRGNPGGYLNEAVDLLSQFFTEGKLLVFTQGRAEKKKEYKSNGRARYNIENIAILIDEGSASASEIVAGAIQDHDRGWIIGRRSYGKGLVQEQYPLSDGGALRLTVARYYTPSGRSIQRNYQNGAEEYAHETERRLQNGELSNSDKIKFEDTTRFYTGLGRIVYGGGGIMPDIFIPLDTSFAHPHFFEVRQLLPLFTSRWLEQTGRQNLPGSLEEFMKFQISEDLMAQLLQFAAKESTRKDTQLPPKSILELKHLLKARIAKLLFDDLGLYKILNEDDPAIEEARSVLRSGLPITRK